MKLPLIIISFFFVSCSSDVVELDVLRSYELGLADAKSNNRNVLLLFDFYGNATNSTVEFLLDSEWRESLSAYSIVLLMVDDKTASSYEHTSGEENFAFQKKSFLTDNQPMYYILDNKGKVLKGPQEYCKKEEFEEFIRPLSPTMPNK